MLDMNLSRPLVDIVQNLGTNDRCFHSVLGLANEIFPRRETQKLLVVRDAHGQRWCTVDPDDAFCQLLVVCSLHLRHPSPICEFHITAPFIDNHI